MRAKVREAAIWQLPARARHYVLTVDAIALLALVVVVARASWRANDAIAAATFVACGLISIEVFRRVGAPHRRADRPYHDLLSAFLVPSVLVLPTVYAALTPIAIHLIVQYRSTRLIPVKRVFNMAVGWSASPSPASSGWHWCPP